VFVSFETVCDLTRFIPYLHIVIPHSSTPGLNLPFHSFPSQTPSTYPTAFHGLTKIGWLRSIHGSGRVGLGWVGSQNYPTWVGQVGSETATGLRRRLARI